MLVQMRIINAILVLVIWTATSEAQRNIRQDPKINEADYVSCKICDCNGQAIRSCIIGGFLDLTTQAQRCTTPLGKPGVCLSIKKCGSLVELLVQHRHRQEVVAYLRKSVCSYDNLEPIVCCSKIEGGLIEPERTTPFRPTTEPTRPRPLPSSTEFYNGNTNNLLPRAGQCGISTHSDLRVVGGVNASLGDWPWVAALGYQSTKTPGKIVYLCGGSIITNFHILTAAHCVYNRKNLITVRVGDLNLYDDLDGATPVEIPIAQKIIHAGYNPTTFVNDIAILRLSRPIQYSKLIQPICLPLSQELRSNNYLRAKPFVAGWGTTSFNGPSSNTMQYIQIPVVRASECQRAFSSFKTAVIDDRVLCAGFLRGGKDACKGDSGGPLMANEFINGRGTYVQIGVVSYGYKCAEPGFPGVYTRVTSFLDWILDNLE